jgi:hypothetical protein
MQITCLACTFAVLAEARPYGRPLVNPCICYGLRLQISDIYLRWLTNYRAHPPAPLCLAAQQLTRYPRPLTAAAPTLGRSPACIVFALALQLSSIGQ